MSIFEFVTVAVSIILGLAVAQLLTSGIDLFRHRNRLVFSWIPLVWAVDMFWLLIILWWQLFGVSQRLNEWTFIDFILTICLVVSLFVACSLVLPRSIEKSKVDLYEFFSVEGRWGVAAYAVFFMFAVPYNNRLYGAPFLTVGNMLIGALVLTAVGAVLSRSRVQAGLFTAAFVVVHTVNISRVLFPSFGG